MIRVGQGFDVHRLVEGRRLILGGVEIPHERGLEGYSDADVLVHAVGSALLGAIGAGDLGTHFPTSDPKWQDAPGSRLLGRILDLVRDAGYLLENVDSTIVAEQPRLASQRPAIQKGLARMLAVEESRVNVKLTSTDQTGAIGRGEALAALAVVLVRENT